MGVPDDIQKDVVAHILKDMVDVVVRIQEDNLVGVVGCIPKNNLEVDIADHTQEDVVGYILKGMMVGIVVRILGNYRLELHTR